MAVINIIDNDDPNVVRFTIPASIAASFAGKPVTFDPETGHWLVARRDLRRMLDWLHDNGHVTATSGTRPLPQPPNIIDVLRAVQPTPGTPGSAAMHTVRAAHTAASQAADEARRLWAADHPDGHRYSPEANRAVMQAAAAAVAALLDQPETT